MAFDVRINFVGLLHFVQNTALDRAFKLGIALPRLSGHTGELKSGSAIFVPHGGGAPQNLISINGHRVFLRFNRSSGNVHYSYSENQITQNPKGLITFEAIAGGFGPQAANVVSIQPGNLVEAQVFLQEGRFGISLEPSDIYEWDLPSGLTSARKTKISTKFFADVTTVDSLQIVLIPIRGGARARLFTVTSSTKVEMELVHSCRPNPRINLEEREEPFLFKDEDFIAHYRLLDSGTQGRIAERVGGLDRAPVPERMVDPAEDREKRSDPGGGCNCLGAAAVNQFFEMEGHFESALRQATDS